MKIFKTKYLAIFFIALCICAVFFSRQSADKYYRTFYQSNDFRVSYADEYSNDTAEYLMFNKTGDIKIISKNNVSLKSGEYEVELQYAASDNITNFKIYAGDYVSSDNSGPKIFINENLSKDDSSLRAEFVLDQPIDNLYIVFETVDPAFTIGRVTMASNNYIYTDTFFYIFITILFAITLFIIINYKYKNKSPIQFYGEEIPCKNVMLAFLFIMAGAIFVASIPVFSAELLMGHDTYFHLARIEGLARALESGQFPVRVHGGTINNYGYPNSLFYPELMLYLPAFLSILGVSTATAFKVFIVFINVLTLTLSYIAFKKFFNSKYIATAASIIYLLNPYRIICLYYRSAIGEVSAITFLPLVLYGLYAIIFKDKKDYFYLVIGACGVLQSHFISTEMVAVFCFIVVLVLIKQLFTKEKRILTLIYAAVITALLNVWFLGPMLLMMTQLGLAVFGRSQSPIGYASFDVYRLFNFANLADIGPHPIGWALLLGMLLYVLCRILFYKKAQHNGLIKYADILLCITVVCIIGTTAFFPWEVLVELPLIGAAIDVIQFPYRLLSIILPCATFIVFVAICLWIKKANHKIAACIIFSILAVISTTVLYEFSIYTNVYRTETKHYYENNFDNILSIGQGEYLVEGSNTDIMAGEHPLIESDNTTLQIENLYRYGTISTFDYTMDLTKGEENIISMPISYIPNYEILVNGVEVAPIKHEFGRVAFIASEESGNVSVKYKSPLTFRVFEIISLFTLLFVIFKNKILLIIKKHVKFKAKNNI